MLTQRFLIIIAILNFCFACRKTEVIGPSEFVENGEVWAYGVVKLGKIERPGQILLENLTPDQNIDSPDLKFRLIAKSNAASDDAEKEVVYYVDYEPNTERKLAYVFDWKFQKVAFTGQNSRPSSSGISVTAVLKKPSQSFDSKAIRIANAYFPSSIPKPVTLSTDVEFSQIIDGYKTGHWALHSNKLKRDSEGNITLCSHAQLRSGLLENQFVVVKNSAECKPSSASEDLCNGNPSLPGCLPQVLDQPQSNLLLDLNSLQRFEMLTDKKVLKFKGDEDLPGEMLFIAKDVAATNDNNAELCNNKFYVTCRTPFGQVNPACKLTRAPSPTSVNAKLACRIIFQDQQADSYQKRVFMITANLVGDEDKSFTVVAIK